MEPWSTASLADLAHIDFVLTDVDDTLTSGGRLVGSTLDALASLREAGIKVMPVTAAPAGWASLMVNMWPVDAVIAENGGLAFLRSAGGWERHFFDTNALPRLERLAHDLAQRFPDLSRSLDAPYRETCVSFGRPDDPVLTRAVLRHLGAVGFGGTVNSMWLLAWPGTWDKLAMTRRVLHDHFSMAEHFWFARVIYIGDSENDEIMFSAFPLSAGVASVRDHPLTVWPRWITNGGGGEGFVEVAERIIAARNAARR